MKYLVPAPWPLGRHCSLLGATVDDDSVKKLQYEYGVDHTVLCDTVIPSGTQAIPSELAT